MCTWPNNDSLPYTRSTATIILLLLLLKAAGSSIYTPYTGHRVGGVPCTPCTLCTRTSARRESRKRVSSSDDGRSQTAANIFSPSIFRQSRVVRRRCDSKIYGDVFNSNNGPRVSRDLQRTFHTSSRKTISPALQRKSRRERRDLNARSSDRKTRSYP